MLGKCIITIS